MPTPIRGDDSSLGRKEAAAGMAHPTSPVRSALRTGNPMVLEPPIRLPPCNTSQGAIPSIGGRGAESSPGSIPGTRARETARCRRWSQTVLPARGDTLTVFA